ncbi:DDE-type integrase/transposase/recombinase (plasmid) [Rhizobium leguminosarum]
MLGRWRYLYQSIDKRGNLVGFLLTAKRVTRVAKCIFRCTLHRNN